MPKIKTIDNFRLAGMEVSRQYKIEPKVEESPEVLKERI